MLQARTFLSLGAFSAGCAVLLNAALAHIPTTGQILSPASLQNALNMHQLHALGLLLVGLMAVRSEAPSRWCLAGGWLMVTGTLLFSVNLYLRGLAGIDTFRALVPWGGAAYLLA